MDIAVSLRSTVSQSALHCQFCDSCCRNRSVCFGIDVSSPTQAPKIEKVKNKNKQKRADFLFLLLLLSTFPPLAFFVVVVLFVCLLLLTFFTPPFFFIFFFLYETKAVTMMYGHYKDRGEGNHDHENADVAGNIDVLLKN